MAKRNIDTAHIDGMENLKPGEGIQVDKETKYEYGSQLDTGGFRLEDPSEGQQVSIRTFTFRINPAKRREIETISKQAIFNQHAKQITNVLWGDGLRPLEEVSPRVILNVKKGFYQIFIPCQAAKGVIWSSKDKPKNLQEITRNSAPSNK